MRKAAPKAGGTSRVRFVMFEAEVAEGEIGEITQAIQTAMRGTNRVPSQAAALRPPEINAYENHEPEVDQSDVVDEVDAAPVSVRPRAPRKPAPKPSVIEVDVSSEPPLSSLADPGSNHKRYLKLAAWLHDSRGMEAITADHIYTCYRHLGWPIGIQDFAQPLRELKHKQYFTTPERGQYAINQLGLAKAAENDSD